MIQRPRQKFVEPEWKHANQKLYACSEVERSRAEKLVDDVEVVISETRKLTANVQRDVNRKLEQRVNDMEHWETEINFHLDRVKVQIDSLEATAGRLNKAREAMKEPIHINDACIAAREQRKGIELVHDEAEKELLKEEEVLRGVVLLYNRTDEQLQEQLRLARKMRYQLEKDIQNRSEAVNIDRENIELKNHQFNIQLNNLSQFAARRPTSVDEWESLTNDRINQSNQIVKNCTDLQSLVSGILKQTSEDMASQKKLTDEALSRRIYDVRNAKDKLEEHLAKLRQQITETEINMEKLLKAIEEKKPAKLLAAKRLENRCQRASIELCNDAVQYKLMEESMMIEQSVEKLEQAYEKAKFCLKNLRQKEVDLEEEIALKVMTLAIDASEVECMRKSLLIREY
ncbi:hypothetical protein HELRODRAFT_193843 [Helobdella robusta]|uniref:Tektin n=1 Tax=Helobdella robusta TaxID=6412 RepID=T1FVE9_HELRO|nr:hypothetical protein HELRODRAFT_193843 [Helobdella robusta]ESN94123.1 hypothetical protein HELRODRAFT_193843 [Helobdella robusta]